MTCKNGLVIAHVALLLSGFWYMQGVAIGP